MYYCEYYFLRNEQVSALCMWAALGLLTGAWWPATARWAATENGNTVKNNCSKKTATDEHLKANFSEKGIRRLEAT